MFMQKTITQSRFELIRGDELKKYGNRIIQIDTTAQYQNGNYGVYICEVDYTEQSEN